MKETFDSLLDRITINGMIPKALGELKSRWNIIWGGLASRFRSLLSPIFSAIEGLQSAIDGVMAAYNSVRNLRVPALDVVGRVFNSGSSSGVHMPPAPLVSGGGGGGSDPTTGGNDNSVNVTIQGNVLDGDDFYDRVNQVRTQYGRRGN